VRDVISLSSLSPSLIITITITLHHHHHHHSSSSRSTTPSLIARSYKKGEQLFENYGQPNHIYFTYHGFILPNNTHDCVYMELALTKHDLSRIDAKKAQPILQVLMNTCFAVMNCCWRDVMILLIMIASDIMCELSAIFPLINYLLYYHHHHHHHLSIEAPPVTQPGLFY